MGGDGSSRHRAVGWGDGGRGRGGGDALFAPPLVVLLVVQILAEQQIVVGPGQMPDELLKAVEAQRAEATGEGVVRGRYYPSVHRA